MVMKFPNVASKLALLWTDRMDVYFVEEEVSPSGETIRKYSTLPALKDQICRISFPNPDKAVPFNDMQESVLSDPKVICDRSLDIPAGSRIEVRRLSSSGDVYQSFEGLVLKSANPSKYESHQEFFLNMFGDA